MPDTTAPTREQLFRELEKVQAQLDKARRRRDADAIAYAATPDGAAETFRRYELCRDPEERAQLKTTYLAGLTSAAEEYEERRKRGNASDNDGPLAAIPVGPFQDPLTKTLVEQRIMATFRNTPTAADTNTITVTLLRLLPDQQTRKRTRIDVPADAGILTADLTDIVAQAWTQTRTQTRLRSFLTEAATTVTTAINQRDTQ